MMRCHYEVLAVDRKSSFDEIRAAYKKQALLCHPDKNHGNTEEAAQRFKDVQNAYAVLSDASEREWYDSHRDSILNGDGEGTCAPDELNVCDFFSARCYTGFGDDEDSFFSVYKRVFDTLIDEEMHYSESAKGWPRFGKSDSVYRDVAKFYSHWKNFNTNKTFAWKDEYKLNEIPDRQSRRAAERINIKERSAARRNFTTLVVELAELVMRRDPRVAAEKKRLEEEQTIKDAERMKREEAAAVRRREANEKLWAEAAEKETREMKERQERGDHDDGEVLELLYEKQRQMERRRKKGGSTQVGRTDDAVLEEEAAAGGVQHEDEDEPPTDKQMLQCKACKKSFGAEKQLAEHIKSAKHNARLRQLAARGVDVAALMGEVPRASCNEDPTPSSGAPSEKPCVEGSTTKKHANKKGVAEAKAAPRPLEKSKSESDSESSEEETFATKRNAFQVFTQKRK
jgi:DnaJ homolog subfamily A member 5